MDIDLATEVLDTYGTDEARRVYFKDGEAYEFVVVVVSQDQDEKHPHVTAEVRSVLARRDPSRRCFKQGSVMFFTVADVERVEDARTGDVLYAA